MSTRQLTTTSYAILGVLAIRPWSAYELTAYMRTSAVRNVWPRTESRLYAEPKNLIEHGLAKASQEYTGRRKRTVYRITGRGRKALTSWLSQRAARAESQDEAMLKILLCEHGTRSQLQTTIRWAMEDLLDQISVVMEFGDRLAKGNARFPERLHVNALAARRGIAGLRARFEFLRWAEGWVSRWDGTALDASKRQDAQAVLTDAQAELEELDRELRATLGKEDTGSVPRTR